jgi:hypothetical protein
MLGVGIDERAVEIEEKGGGHGAFRRERSALLRRAGLEGELSKGPRAKSMPINKSQQLSALA